MTLPQPLQSRAEFALPETGTLTLELTGLVDPQLMIPDLEADSKLGAIKLLVDRLHQREVVGDSLSFLQSVLERENLMSTVLDGEVALPHARSRSLAGAGSGGATTRAGRRSPSMSTVSSVPASACWSGR